ncbi:MAG: 30S ribosomal protein S18 [Coriobacteriia bacterium]|nr:30S ribosomal protein S18 [Coriobacteriia bacterium]
MATEYARQPKKKVCPFDKDKNQYIDYKYTNLHQKKKTDRRKIKPRRVTGTCMQHQRDLAIAIKRAREMALLPYTVAVISGRGRNR